MRVGLAAFADKDRWDTDTAALVGYFDPTYQYIDQTIVEDISFSGAPFLLIGRKDTITPYGIVTTNKRPEARQLRDEMSYEQLDEFFINYRTDINPRQILDVKSGLSHFIAFPEVNPIQLRLFAFPITRDLLARNFEGAVNSLRQSMITKKELPPINTNTVVTQIAVQLLGAIVLAHRGKLGPKLEDPNASFADVFNEAAKLFPRYFERSLIEENARLASEAYSLLQTATYSSFTPDMLDELYTRAYPDRIKRKLEGRFDTPLYLTRRILENIPIESIAPKDRLVVDMTCGWGSFLIAGYERLNRMTDMKESEYPLSKHILGNDIDQFTAQLASLALMTASSSDHWQVDAKDALSWTPPGDSPTVVVGNPKFSGNRKSGNATTALDPKGKRKRLQEADYFLDRAISLLRSGGFVAMLMPKSFSVDEASSYLRKNLLETCDVLEIWDLPDQVFQDQAKVRPVVVFARKRERAGTACAYPVRVRSIQGNNLQSFSLFGKFTASTLVRSQTKWTERRQGTSHSTVTHIMDYTTILDEKEWLDLRGRNLRLVEVANRISGLIKGKDERRKRYLDTPSRLVPFLVGAKESIPRPFYIQYGNKTILYPKALEKPRLVDESKLRGIKVLLVSDPDPSWGRRVKVAIDRQGYYPSNHFWILTPIEGDSPEITNEVIAAVLSWDVANAWIIDNLRYPWIQSRTLDDIPFPHLSIEDCQVIQAAVHNIEDVAVDGGTDAHAQGLLDKIFIKAYKLNDLEFKRLRQVTEWKQNQPELDNIPDPQKIISVSGQVNSVNISSNEMNLWFDGIPGTHSVPITDEIPGWMLRPGAGFRGSVTAQSLAKRRWRALHWFNIRPKEYTYMSEEELIERIGLELARI